MKLLNLHRDNGGYVGCSQTLRKVSKKSASAHLTMLANLQKLLMQPRAACPCLLLVRHQQNAASMGRINGQVLWAESMGRVQWADQWAESMGRTNKEADRRGSEHGILRWVCSLVVPQLIGAPKLMLLLWGPELHMGLGVVVGHP